MKRRCSSSGLRSFRCRIIHRRPWRFKGSLRCKVIVSRTMLRRNDCKGYTLDSRRVHRSNSGGFPGQFTGIGDGTPSAARFSSWNPPASIGAEGDCCPDQAGRPVTCGTWSSMKPPRDRKMQNQECHEGIKGCYMANRGNPRWAGGQLSYECIESMTLERAALTRKFESWR